MHGRSRGSCAEWSIISHTLGEREASMRLLGITNLRTEPRASSSGSVTPVPTADSMYGAGVVYPGMYRVVYTPGYIGRHTTGIYTRVYHPGRHIGRYTPYHTLVYTT